MACSLKIGCFENPLNLCPPNRFGKVLRPDGQPSHQLIDTYRPLLSDKTDRPKTLPLTGQRFQKWPDVNRPLSAFFHVSRQADRIAGLGL